MKTTSSLTRFAATAAIMLFSAQGHAYKAVEVSNGGTISGKITLDGTPPPNPTLKVTKDQDYCGASIPADYYVVGADGGLKNVVVMIENIDQGKAYDKKAVVELDNKKCMFEPHVEVAVRGQKLGIVSRDPILHNTHLYHGPKQRTMYNVAIPLQDRVIKKPLRKPGEVTVKCDAHEWMLGYVYVANHPYITVTADDGAFTLTDVPPGTYKLKIWHEKLGETTQDVTVSAGGTAEVKYAFKP
ncbi:MAG TPA: hypothetical protein ENI93_07195 [Gammaproteobacteria bacterium]|nr:hypothetical protein [Gammaproteobacteria bacterium]